MTISEALIWAANVLKENGVEGPRSSARLLLQQIFDRDLAYLFTYSDNILTDAQEARFRDWVGRRSNHEPVWYIADNQIKFCEKIFHVDKNVLIPRPETEILIEKIIEKINGGSTPKSILDVGTGSGAIILALANSLFRHPEPSEGSRTPILDSSVQPQNDGGVAFFASDISEEALAVAKKNAKNILSRHSSEGWNPAVEFRKGDLFEPWKDQRFDLIVTNLPYIPHEDLPYLDKDVVQYEPLLALDGGRKGLEVYQKFFDTINLHLNPGALIYCEIGHNQGSEIMKMAARALANSKSSLIKDYANKDRIVIIET